jgi:DNA repair protein RadC
VRYRLRLATWTVVREPGQPSPRLLSDPEAAGLLALDLVRARDDDKEHFFAVLLNAQNHYLMHTEVSVGTQSSSLVHPREVLGPALREGASSLILVHNHPSGDPTPSREDVRLTRQLVDATQLLDLRIHDHIIVGNGTNRWVSLAQRAQL